MTRGRRMAAHADKGEGLLTSFQVGDHSDPLVNILQSGESFLYFVNLC